ncbi:hypothetical protein DFJ74DRAFT_432249 [Hyaloraphidium curvatum]|nr:hypothetical protein DFJ74DRAFT_432249 [Hyaloraphidium curvatum]
MKVPRVALPVLGLALLFLLQWKWTPQLPGEPSPLPAPRAADRPFRLAMCSHIRNEERALLEWIAHNTLLGVEHFFLYDHFSDDGSHELLQPLVARGLVSVFAVPNVTVPQKWAFEHCLTLRNRTEWVVATDPDEFFFLDARLGLHSLADFADRLRAETGCEAIYVHRHHFGTGGRERAPSREPETWRRVGAGGKEVPCPLTMCNYVERKRKSAMRTVPGGKMIFRPERVTYFGAHMLQGTDAVVDVRGRRMVPLDIKTYGKEYSPLRIHHYVTRSVEECRAKTDTPGRRAPPWRQAVGDKLCLGLHKGSQMYDPQIMVGDETLLPQAVPVMVRMCSLDRARAEQFGVPCKDLAELTELPVSKPATSTGDSSSSLVKLLEELSDDQVD